MVEQNINKQHRTHRVYSFHILKTNECEKKRTMELAVISAIVSRNSLHISA